MEFVEAIKGKGRELSWFGLVWWGVAACIHIITGKGGSDMDIYNFDGFVLFKTFFSRLFFNLDFEKLHAAFTLIKVFFIYKFIKIIFIKTFKIKK